MDRNELEVVVFGVGVFLVALVRRTDPYCGTSNLEGKLNCIIHIPMISNEEISARYSKFWFACEGLHQIIFYPEPSDSGLC